MENKMIRVAITHGDTNGTGYEMIFKAFEDPAMLELCTPIIYGSPKVATYHRKALNLQTNFAIINKAEDACDGRINLLTTFEEEIKVELGKPTEESGNAALKAIDRAIEDYKEGLFDVLVTAPVESSNAFRFSGQSRYIEDHTDSCGKGYDILVSDKMRMAFATRNLPIRQVAEVFTKENIAERIRLLHSSLRRDFRVSNPRIAVLALNPKAGDNGITGSEEQETMIPAIGETVENGIQAFGPYAADEFFDKGLHNSFDGIIAAYHDQGLIPFRMTGEGNEVCYTAGLPVIVTAPETGASINDAGKNITDAAAMRNAIFLATDIFRHREEYDTPLESPLKKFYHERRDDSEKVRFSTPKGKEEKAE